MTKKEMLSEIYITVKSTWGDYSWTSYIRLWNILKHCLDNNDQDCCMDIINYIDHYSFYLPIELRCESDIEYIYTVIKNGQTDNNWYN